MADIAGILGSSLKDKVLGVTKTQKVVKENPNTLLKIVGKNFLSLPGFARDLNVARQNIQRLVKLEGGKPAKGADAYFLKESEREKKLETEMAAKKPTPTAGQALKKGLIRMALFKLLGIVFTSFVKVLQKYFTPIIILGAIFIGFKDAFAEWVTGLWDAIKTKFGEFVDDIKEWFSESIQPIIDKVMEFIQPVIDTISGFFQKIGDFFVGYFNTWKDLITSPIQTIKTIYDGFMNKVNGLLDMLPEWVKEKLGIPKKGEVAVDDSAERKKLERQQAEAKETERIKKLEKEKQYTGEDEIVRQRLGLPPKTETQKQEEAAKKKSAAPVESAPRPEPLIVPGPAPSVPPTAPKPAPAPAPAASAPAPAPKKEKVEGAPSGVEPLIKKISPEAGKKAMLDEMNRQNVSDPTARAAIMAQAAKETGGFMFLSEDLGYRASGLRKTFQRLKGASDEQLNTAVKGGAASIGELIYGGSKDSPSYDFGVKQLGNTEPGDGAKFRGRGFFQLTGRANYKRAGALENPGKLLDMGEAAKTAVDFALRYKGNFGNTKEFTKYVNGAYLGLEERTKYFQTFINDPSITKIGASTTAASGENVAAASSGVASGQRAQAKPQTPVVVNAPTNNTTVVNKTQVVSKPKQDTGGSLATARA